MPTTDDRLIAAWVSIFNNTRSYDNPPMYTIELMARHIAADPTVLLRLARCIHAAGVFEGTMRRGEQHTAIVASVYAAINDATNGAWRRPAPPPDPNGPTVEELLRDMRIELPATPKEE